MAIDANILSQLITMQPGGQPPRNVFEKASREMEDERQRQADRKTSQNLQALKFIQGQQDRQMSLSDRDIRLARDATQAERADVTFDRRTTTHKQEQKDRKTRLDRQKIKWAREDREWQNTVDSYALAGKNLEIKAIEDRSKGIRDSMFSFADTFGTEEKPKSGWEAYISKAYVEEQLKPFNIDSDDKETRTILKNAWRNTRAYLGNAGQFVENPNQLGNLESIFKMHFDKAVSEGVELTGERGIFSEAKGVFEPGSLTSPGTDDYTIEEVGETK